MIITSLVNTVLSKRGYELTRIDAEPSWPHTEVPDQNVDYLFLLTPPNSGSTAIADFAAQLSAIGGVYHNYEGQWLIKGMCKEDRWWPEKLVDYDSIRTVWNEQVEKLKAEGDIRYIFEKSPPTLVRYRAFARHFPRARFVVNNRDPYANIASQFKRYADKFEGNKRANIIGYYARLWVFRSRFLRRAVEVDGYPMMTYEAFCEEPGRIFSCFGIDASKEGIDENYAVRVKDYASQGIVNQNEKQVGLLKDEDIATINGELRGHDDLLASFGYELRT